MKKSDHRAAILWGSLSVFMLLFIFGQSLLPPNESGEMSGFVMMLLSPLMDLFDGVDPEAFHHFIRKAAHFSEYALFSLFFTRFCGKIRWNRVILPLFVCVLVAVSDEFLQSFTGRGSSVRDVVLDFSGALFSFVILWLLSHISFKKENKNEA